MKFLYIRSQFDIGLKAGGSVGHTSGVINALSDKDDIELRIFSNDFLPGVRGKIMFIKPFKKKNIPKGILELLTNLKFLAYFLKHNINGDTIYTRYAPFSFFAAYWSKKKKIPLVLEFNGSELWIMKNWHFKDDSRWKALLKLIYKLCFAYPIAARNELYNLKIAKIIVVVSQVLRDDLVKQGVAAEKILVNPNGVDAEKFRPHCGGEGIRKKYALTGKTVVGFIGTFGQWHGVCELAQAIVAFFRKAPRYRETTRFLLIGDGVLREELKKILQDGGVEDEVILTGLIPQEEAPKYLDACDIFVSPHIPNPDGTKFFGSPTKLFEYMAMGRGIVASDLEQIGDVLEHDKTAYLVEPGNVTDLAKGIKALVDDKELRERLGKNARKKVIANYTWDKHVARILDAAEKITAKGNF